MKIRKFGDYWCLIKYRMHLVSSCVKIITQINQMQCLCIKNHHEVIYRVTYNTCFYSLHDKELPILIQPLSTMKKKINGGMGHSQKKTHNSAECFLKTQIYFYIKKCKCSSSLSQESASKKHLKWQNHKENPVISNVLQWMGTYNSEFLQIKVLLSEKKVGSTYHRLEIKSKVEIFLR